MPLREIVEENDDARGGDLGNGFVPVEALHEELEENIVDDQAADDDQHIPRELYLAPQVRTMKGDVHAQVKTDREGNEEGHEKRGIVRLQRNEADMDDGLFKYKIIGDRIDKEAQNGIGAAAGRVMIGLQGHEPPEDGIENIQHLKDRRTYGIVHSSHEGCENNSKSGSLVTDFVNWR
jgi:hypothetical protein